MQNRPNTSSPTADSQELFSQALQLHQAGDLSAAQALYSNILLIQPDHCDALANLGTIHLQRQNFDECIRAVAQSLQINPNQPQALYNIGYAFHRLGKLNEALQYYELAIALKPDYMEAHFNLALLMQNMQRMQEALVGYNRVIELDAGRAEAFNNRGNVLTSLKRFDEAIASFDQAIMLKPQYVEAYNNRGSALRSLGRLEQAVTSFDRAIALNPNDAVAFYNRGNTLKEMSRFTEALASFEHALALDPKHAVAFNNRGLVLREMNRLGDALASFDQAIALNPGYVEALSNRGNTLQGLRQTKAALANYDRAIELDPGYASAHWNKSLLKLLEGDYKAGWELYEWRWKDQATSLIRDFSQPLWLGAQPVAGKTILLHAEQGLGDVIQFCRYAKLVEALGAKVVLELPKTLAPLCASLGSDIMIVERGSALPAFDLHCPIMSLPLAFKTTVETIPVEIPYLAVKDEKQKTWQQRLGTRKIPRVGLVWSGSNNGDSNRAIPLYLLEPLMQLPLEFHSLQLEVRDEDKPALSNFHQIRTHHDALIDFADTAALTQEMDIILSVCTSVAHLAGALGKPCCILLSYAADCRWMLDRNDSPWYPTAKLFRQDILGDWSNVIKDISEVLKLL